MDSIYIYIKEHVLNKNHMTISNYFNKENKTVKYYNHLLEKYTYIHSPLSYKILYDKYYRSEYYNSVINESNNEKILPVDKIPVHEMYYIEYFQKRANSEFKMLLLGGISSLFCLLFSISVNNYDENKTKFIFIDNNRYFNNYITKGKFAVHGLAISIFLVYSQYSMFIYLKSKSMKSCFMFDEERRIIIEYEKEREIYFNKVI